MEPWGRLVAGIVLMVALFPMLAWLGRHAERRVQVSYMSRRAHRFRLVRPGRFGWWVRRRWTLPAALSGEPAFDAEWTADSRDHELVEALLCRRDVRDSLRALGQIGCHLVTQERTRLLASVTVPQGTRPSESDHIEPVRQALRALDAAVSQVLRPREPPHRLPSWRLISMAAFLVPGVLTLFGFFMVRTMEVPALAQLWWPAIVTGIPLGVLCVPVVSWFTRGHTGSLEDFVGPCLLLAMLWSGVVMVTAMELNERLDKGPVRVLEAQVVAVDDTPGQTRYDYDDVIVKSPGADTEKSLRVPSPIAMDLRPHKSWLIVTTSPGWLGVEWRVSLCVESRPEAK